MCGIAGFIGAGDAQDLLRMGERQQHRGPDASGTWLDRDRRVYLGHQRLSILDIHDGQQPMSNKDNSLVVVFNGEIYNHAELRKELEGKGHVFFTDHSDTEVLLHGYRQWGKELPGHLNGMWSFALYDVKQGLLFCSRDRFGKKPFYFAPKEDSFVFASELSSLVQHSEVNGEVDPLALKKYFAYGFIPSPLSIYRGIFKLPAAHNLVFDLARQTVVTRPYWSFRLDESPAKAEEALAEELHELLKKAVCRRMVADVPLGIFLSGGLDSSTIAALAVDAGSTTPVQTYSIGFENEAFDESVYAEEVARFLRTEHTIRKIDVGSALEVMPMVIGQLDEPMGDSSLIPSYLLCKHARERVTVALGGDGADEMLAGYGPFKALKLARRYQSVIPGAVHGAIRALSGLLPVRHYYMSTDFKIKRFLRGLSYPEALWNPVWLGPLEPSELTGLFEVPIRVEEVYEEAIKVWEECDSDSDIDRTLSFYTRLYLPDNILVKMDRASMMNSLEVRSPFLDIDLVNFFSRLPREFKFRNGVSKYLLRNLAKSLLPPRILNRSKQGFAIPLGEWFRKRHLQISDISPVGSQNQRYIQSMVQSHVDGRADNRLFLWNQWVLNNNSL